MSRQLKWGVLSCEKAGSRSSAGMRRCLTMLHAAVLALRSCAVAKCPEEWHQEECRRTILLVIPVVAKCQCNHAVALLELQTGLQGQLHHMDRRPADS